MTAKKAKSPKASTPVWQKVGFEFNIKCKVTSVERDGIYLDLGKDWDSAYFRFDDFKSFLANNVSPFKGELLQEQIKETKAKLAQLEKELGEIK